MKFQDLNERISWRYKSLRHPVKSFARDLDNLVYLGAIVYRGPLEFSIHLQWPTEITRTEFFRKVKEFPKAKTSHLLP
jgi:hypothetical protein